MISVSGLLVNIRAQLVESEAAFYTDTELCTYLTQGEMQVANTLECLNGSSIISGLAGTREYSRPSGSIVIEGVTWNNFNLIKINESDIPYIEGSQYGFTGATGNPIYYYEEAEIIGLSPIPSLSQLIEVSYSKNPDPLTVSGRFSIPDQFVYQLIDYVLYRCYIKDNDHQRAIFHINLWNTNIQKAQTDYARRQRANQTVVVQDRQYNQTLIY